MFPNHYGHVSRVPVTGSSFYIRDILGNSDSGYSESQSKIYSYDSGNYLTNYSTPSMLTYPQLGYPGPSYRGFSSEFIDHATSPVPLPVYIRSRSPSDIDGFSKPRRCRRSRTVFTELQLMGLEKKFESHKYLSTPDRIELAETLGLSQVQVKTWYQNRRMKWKKTVLQKCGTEEAMKLKGRPGKESISENSPSLPVTTQNELDTFENGNKCVKNKTLSSANFHQINHNVNNSSNLA